MLVLPAASATDNITFSRVPVTETQPQLSIQRLLVAHIIVLMEKHPRTETI